MRTSMLGRTMRQALVLLFARSLPFKGGSQTTATAPIVASAWLLSSSSSSSSSSSWSSSRSPSAFVPPDTTARRGIAAVATRPSLLMAKPKKAGSTVDAYQTVSVNCGKCRQRLFRYKKKNGTKSNLVKCYVERISEDSAGILARAAAAAAAADRAPEASRDTAAAPPPVPGSPRGGKNRRRKGNRETKPANSGDSNGDGGAAAEKPVVPTRLDPEYAWLCPGCDVRFARSSVIHGRPALKLVGGKVRMTKK